MSELLSQARIESVSSSSLSSTAGVSSFDDSSPPVDYASVDVVDEASPLAVELAPLVALLEQPATAPRIDADAKTAAKILFFIGNSSRIIHFVLYRQAIYTA